MIPPTWYRKKYNGLELECIKCGFTWIRRSKNYPLCCPRCKQYRYFEQYVRRRK